MTSLFAHPTRTDPTGSGVHDSRRHPHRFDRRLWVRWLASFIGFPLAGLAAKAATGPIDATEAAAIGGLAAGATLGAVQALALRRSWAQRAEWTTATAVGLAGGLAVGATLVDFAFDTSSLVTMGLASGAGVGIAQTLVLTGRWTHRVAWLLATIGLWGLGWLITSNVISDTDSRYATFGASGALVATALGGILLAAGADQNSRSLAPSIPRSTAPSPSNTTNTNRSTS